MSREAVPARALIDRLGRMSALHLRRIAKRLHQLAGRDAGPFETGYAGPW